MFIFDKYSPLKIEKLTIQQFFINNLLKNKFAFSSIGRMLITLWCTRLYMVSIVDKLTPDIAK